MALVGSAQPRERVPDIAQQPEAEWQALRMTEPMPFGIEDIVVKQGRPTFMIRKRVAVQREFAMIEAVHMIEKGEHAAQCRRTHFDERAGRQTECVGSGIRIRAGFFLIAKRTDEFGPHHLHRRDEVLSDRREDRIIARARRLIGARGAVADGVGSRVVGT